MNLLKMECVAIEDRIDYFVVYLHVQSSEGNALNTYADGTVGFTISWEQVSQYEVGKFYDLNLQEIVVSE